MAEIRSTLDIIMEKTKNLTLTEEEKKAFRKKEIEGKVKGLMLKFIDGLMDLNNLKMEISAIDEKNLEMAMEVVKKETLDRIDPEADNRRLLEILEQVAGIDTTPFERLLSDFNKDLDREKGIHEQRLMKQIQEKGISGSAVLPNIHAHQEWIQFVLDTKEKFRENMQVLVKS